MSPAPPGLSGFLKPVLLLASTLTVMAGATISPALPAIRMHFAETDAADLLTRLVLTLPALFIVLGAPLAGWIADRFGRRTLLLGGLVLYALAGSSGLVVGSLEALLVGRALLGLAVGAIMTTATALIADYFDGPERIRLLGLQSAFMAAGGVLFLLAGGTLADHGWRMPFAIYLASLILLPLALISLREPDHNQTQPQGSAPDTPTIPPAEAWPPLPVLALIYGTAFLSQLAFYTIPVQLPFYLKQLIAEGQVAFPAILSAMGAGSGSLAGLAIASATLAAMVASLGYGRVRQRVRPLQIVSLLFVLMGPGFLLMGFAKSLAVLFSGLIIAGLGLGLILPNMSSWLAAITPISLRGRVLSGLPTAIFLGQFTSPLVVQPLIADKAYGQTYTLIGWSAIGLAGGVFLLGRGAYFRK